MQLVLDETTRRRAKQIAYNTEHNINPTTVYKTLEEILQSTSVADIQAHKTKRKMKLSIIETEKLRNQ